EAVDKATRLLGAIQPASGLVTLVLEPRMAGAILGIVPAMLNGESVLKGRSPFADRVGEAIASPLVTLVDDPTDPASLGADTHDGEGGGRGGARRAPRRRGARPRTRARGCPPAGSRSSRTSSWPGSYTTP